MKMHAEVTRLYRFWLTVSAAALILASAALLQSFQNTGAANGESVAATYSHGILRVDIPYRGLRPGAGQLTVEILDPEDHAVAHKELQVAVREADGRWQAELVPAQPPSVDDLVWHRLRYRLDYAGEKTPALEETQSISQILRRPVIHVLAQSSYIAGAPAAVRVIVAELQQRSRHQRQASHRNGWNRSASLIHRFPDGRGTAEAQLQFPAGLTGSYSLHYTVDTPIGSVDVTRAGSVGG